MPGPYRTGMAQRRCTTPSNPTVMNGWVQATLDISRAVTSDASPAADIAYQVTAGVPVSIRWGGTLDGTLYSKVAANSITWWLTCVYETTAPQNTANYWETVSHDSASEGGSAGGHWQLDRTLTFTPTRSGTLRLFVRARVIVTIGGSVVADINTDEGSQFGGTAEVHPTGTQAVDGSYGLVSCGTPLSGLTPSGFASPASQPDTVSLAFTTAHAPRVAATGETYAVSWRSSGDAEFQASTIAAGTVIALPAVTDLVDDSWPAASDPIRVRLTPANSPLSTANGGAGLPWVHFTAVPSGPGTVSHNTTTQQVTFAGAFTADARLSADLHFQPEDDIFGLSKHDSTQELILTSTDGFLWPIIRNARSEGVNGLTVSQSLNPVRPGNTLTASGTTSTQDGQAGVGSRLDWTVAKPGGMWDWTADVTAPAASDADTHLVQSGDFVTALVIDPRLKPIISLSPVVAIEERHLEPGDAMKLSVVMRNSKTRKRVAQDSAPTGFVIRYERTAGWQFLAADGITWTAWGTAAADKHTLVQDTDTFSYSLTFSSTSGWTTTDIVGLDVTCTVDGTPYPEYVQRELVAGFHRHDAPGTLNELADVDTTGVADGDTLVFDGTTWRDEHMPTADEVANAVWDEATAETRPTGSYGQLLKDNLDAKVSSRATPDDVTLEAGGEVS